MSPLRLIVGMLPIGMMVMVADLTYGQDYPNKPIRIITGSPGGSSDFTSRQIAQAIAGPLGQSVIVDNRPTGVVQIEAVYKTPPDGYTLLVAGGSFWTLPLLQKTSYDPVRDFSPITIGNRAPNVLVVHPSVPVKSVKELIALAKARPGELNYASGPTGGPSHLSAELFNHAAGINIVRVTYKGTAPALPDLMSGRVQLTFDDLSTLMPHVKSGKLKALAVTSAEPSALAPSLPTVSASGLPGYVSVGMQAMFAPAKTPEPIINRLNQEIVRFLHTAEAKEIYFKNGSEPVGSSPDQLGATMKGEIDRLGKLIKDMGLRTD